MRGLVIGSVFGMIGLFVLFAVGMSAVGALLVELLWNYVTTGLHHNELHLTFPMAWAGTFLLSLIFRPFTITVRRNEE